MIVEVQVSLQDVISGSVDKYFFHVTLEWWFLKPPRHARTSALWLPVISEFISVPRRSASSFNSNTVRSGDELPQFGWVWSNLRMHNTDAQVSGLLSVNVVPQHETCHGVGWRCKSRILADQFNWKYGVVLHRFATTSNQLIASCNLYFGWVCAC